MTILCNSVFLDLSTWPSDDDFGPDSLPLLFFLFPIPNFSVPLSLFSSDPHPPCFSSFHLPSMHPVCVLLINMSLCLPASVSDRHSWAESCHSFSPVYSSPSICPSPPSQGFVLFSAAINLLANRQQSRRLGIGIRFLALRPPKNAGAWN